MRWIGTDYMLEAIGNLRNAQKQPEYIDILKELDEIVIALHDWHEQYHAEPSGQ